MINQMTRKKRPASPEVKPTTRAAREVLKLIIKRKPDPNRKSVEQLLYELRHGL